jgi:hypothetical protein
MREYPGLRNVNILRVFTLTLCVYEIYIEGGCCRMYGGWRMHKIVGSVRENNVEMSRLRTSGKSQNYF